MAKILIVEDDPLLTKMFTTLIENQGHEVVLADNGLDGLEIAEKEQPAIIFMDIMMPGINGLQALEQLKNDAKTKQIPVVVMTNLGQVNDMETVMAKGAYQYLDKSQYDPKQMIAIMNQVLGNSEGGSMTQQINNDNNPPIGAVVSGGQQTGVLSGSGLGPSQVGSGSQPSVNEPVAFQVQPPTVGIPVQAPPVQGQPELNKPEPAPAGATLSSPVVSGVSPTIPIKPAETMEGSSQPVQPSISRVMLSDNAPVSPISVENQVNEPKPSQIGTMNRMEAASQQQIPASGMTQPEVEGTISAGSGEDTAGINAAQDQLSAAAAELAVPQAVDEK